MRSNKMAVSLTSLSFFKCSFEHKSVFINYIKLIILEIVLR